MFKACSLHLYVEDMFIASSRSRYVHCILMFKSRPDLEHEAEYANSQSAQTSKHLDQFLAHATRIFCESSAGDGLTAVQQLNMREEHSDVQTCVWQYSSASTVSAM